MGFFDFIRRVKDTVTDGGKRFFGLASKVSNAVKEGYDKVSKIPVIGNVVKNIGDRVLDTSVGGVKVKDALKVADNIVDKGNRFFNG